MKDLAILPRGGLGDVLYHALFARYVQETLPEFRPVLLAPAYGSFLAALLDVPHVPICSVFTDVSGGLKLRGEAAFFSAFASVRGGCLASFTNDAVDHGLAALFGMSRFDRGVLGNSMFAFDEVSSRFSRNGLNRLLGYRRGAGVNLKHIVARQQRALAEHRVQADLPAEYRRIWMEALKRKVEIGVQRERLVLVFPETARVEKNLTFAQVAVLSRSLSADYRVRIFTRNPEEYVSLPVETAGFEDRFEPLRQICAASAVFTADTFAAHLGGLCGAPTYTIYNCAYRPVWCEYWGAPFENVRHFEFGKGYRLNRDFGAVSLEEDCASFASAVTASGITVEDSTSAMGFGGVLTGAEARS